MKKNLSAKAIKLLRAVQKQILLEPLQFEMTHWFAANGIVSESAAQYIQDGKVPNCGTAACVAGWVITLGTKAKNPLAAARKFAGFRQRKYVSSEEQVVNKANKLLGAVGNHLYYVDSWPGKFAHGSWTEFKALTKKQQARMAVRRIGHFIKTDGQE